MHPLDPGEPTAIGPYRLLGRLGSGGMGRVYLGRSTGGRTVAVKVVHPHFALDEEFRARFRREVDAARRVGGDWTVPVLDADPEAAVPWVATGYAAGPSLAEAVRDLAPLPAHSVRVLVAGLAEALTHVHGLGLVHRDVKPSNVLLTMDGPRLIDFGIARATDGTASLTSTGVSIGSPGYMSPEQILGKGIAGAADVFSLGAVLVYAATGASPFPGDSSASLLYKVVHEEPELDGLDGELRDLARECLAKDAAARPAPAEIARRLAPSGTDALVAAGWLPGPLVERVSRSAVRILDLDTDGTGIAEQPSGPVPFGNSMVGGPPSTAGSAGGSSDARVAGREVPQGSGSFGPPDASYAPVAAPTPAPYVPTQTSSSSGPPGRVSVSVAATSVPGGVDGKGRKVSCTLVLGVAGALAAVTVGSVFVLGLLPGDGKESSDAGKQPPNATASQQPGDGADQGGGKVPASYRGTWEGQAVAANGAVPMGTFRLKVEQGKVGERFAVMTQTDQLGGTCAVDLVLKSVSAKEIVAQGKGQADSAAQCTKNSHTVRLRLVGDDLRYLSENEKSGNPEARMSRVK
ncbi:serine/threonine-protein kinase [Streptomyces sp. NPDC050844]|uniref:serine/threonine-protein kinase n=1 Tax=Streptomyces sp. NPDC050844 TaxID=3155790 RepID=UPI00340051D0